MEWLNEDSIDFLKNGYLLEGVEPEERIRQIAERAEEILGIDGFARKFYDHMSKGWYSLASPIWANFGLSRGLPISCYGSFVEDSMIGILDTAREVGMMSKYGGGTSGYFGYVRGRGAPITNNGFSEGAVNFMRLFNTMIDVTKQGGTRRGSFAAYLPIDHPDIDEFLAIKTEGNPIQGIFTGVNVSDEWMQSMIDGDEDKRNTWAKVLRMRSEIGLPYIFFTDNVNNNSPDVYQDRGMKIHASNLCVTGDQRVVSDRGLLTAKELYEQGGDLRLFDNDEVVSSSPMRLIEKNAKVYKITLNNGMTHTVTGYHKIMTDSGPVEASNLKVGTRVAVQTNKGLFGKAHMPDEAFLVGIWQSAIEDKKVPCFIWRSDEETQWQYVRGLYYGDGTAYVSKSKGNPIQINISSIRYEFLKELQILLQNLGMQTSIRLLRKGGKTSLPDGKGGYKNYETKDCYRLIIGNKNDAIKFNEKTKFLDRRGVNIEKRKYRDNTKKFHKVTSVEYVGNEDVYCVEVYSDKHLWVCNGVVTHNCSEIALSSDEETSFVCDLSSMNVAKYDEWKNTDAVEVLIYFLDAVMTEFIESASKIPGYEKAVNFARQQRALGLGVLGWHDYLQSKSIPFDSYAAMRENNIIFKTIRERALHASKELADLYGEPPLLKGYGRRNTTLMAIAPTTSSAFILGQTSQSIEPYRSNYFVKDLAKKKVTIRNRNLEKVLEEKGCNDEETWMSILENGGSVQHLDCLSDHEKEVFKTFSEISQLAVVQQAAQRQKYIDQSQSLNLMIHPDTPLKDINSLHIEAWKLGVKTLYYQHSVNAAQEFNKDLLTCSACEG